jgi:hypothetical protein
LNIFWQIKTNICTPHSYHHLVVVVSNNELTMAESPPKYPTQKLGEYTVIADIAEGTFGKVKSTHALLIADLLLLRVVSGDAHDYGAQSCHEIHLKSRHPTRKNKDPCPS